MKLFVHIHLPTLTTMLNVWTGPEYTILAGLSPAQRVRGLVILQSWKLFRRVFTTIFFSFNSSIFAQVSILTSNAISQTLEETIF